MRGAGASVIGEIGRDAKGRPWRVELRDMQRARDRWRYGLAYQDLDKKGLWHAEQYGRTYDTLEEAEAQFDKEWRCTSTPPSSPPLSPPASSAGSPSSSPSNSSEVSDPDEDEVLTLAF